MLYFGKLKLYEHCLLGCMIGRSLFREGIFTFKTVGNMAAWAEVIVEGIVR